MPSRHDKLTLTLSRWLRHGVSILLLACTPWLRASDLSVSPVVIRLDRPTDRVTIQVRNNGVETMIAQVETMTWRRVNGKDEEAVTRDLLVNPSIFTVAPQQSQVIRVALRKPMPQSVETAYRLILREVPPAPLSASSGRGPSRVRVLLAMRLPIYVAPSEAKRSAEWKAHADRSGTLTASVFNTGNVHLRLNTLRVRDSLDQQKYYAEESLGTVVFPGEKRDFPLRLSRPLAGQQVALEVDSDPGPQHVSLPIAWER